MKRMLLALSAMAVLAGCGTKPQPPDVTGRMRAPINFHAVHLYVPGCAPGQYERIARLDASKLGGFSSYRFNMHWIRMLRDQAAGLGANGLLVIPVSHAATMGPDRHGPAFRVLAIWEPSVPAPAASTVSGTPRGCSQAVRQFTYEVFHGWGPRAGGG